VEVEIWPYCEGDYRGLSAVWPKCVFCTIMVPGEGIEPSWGRSGGQFEARLYTSA
jgi:hypothetical protein